MARQETENPLNSNGKSFEKKTESGLTNLALKIQQARLSFYIGSIGMIIMLVWGGAFKLTHEGAESIVPLVSNSPLIGWHFKVFGPYVGSAIIGTTEMIAALFILIGFFKPKAGIIGGLIATGMFFTTSTLFFSTPGTVNHINGMGYMSLTGLFLFKDIIALSLSLYLVGDFGKKAATAAKK